EATRRATFLSEASAALASSLDYQATLRRLLELVLPTLGDLGAISQVDEQGGLGQTDVSWVHGQGLATRTATDRHGLPPPLIKVLERVVTEGKAEYLPDMAAADAAPFQQSATSPLHQPTT